MQLQAWLPRHGKDDHGCGNTGLHTASATPALQLQAACSAGPDACTWLHKGYRLAWRRGRCPYPQVLCQCTSQAGAHWQVAGAGPAHVQPLATLLQAEGEQRNHTGIGHRRGDKGGDIQGVMKPAGACTCAWTCTQATALLNSTSPPTTAVEAGASVSVTGEGGGPP